jgi:hypothetical protein
VGDGAAVRDWREIPRAALRESCHWLVGCSGVADRLGHRSGRVNGFSRNGFKILIHLFLFPLNAEIEIKAGKIVRSARKI